MSDDILVLLVEQIEPRAAELAIELRAAGRPALAAEASAALATYRRMIRELRDRSDGPNGVPSIDHFARKD